MKKMPCLFFIFIELNFKRKNDLLVINLLLTRLNLGRSPITNNKKAGKELAIQLFKIREINPE